MGAQNPWIVPAEARTDDNAFVVEFDAEPYLARASDAVLRQLEICGWGGDFPADEVAWYFEDQVLDLHVFFSYLRYVKGFPFHEDISFECYIDPVAAEAWLKENRPHLAPFLGMPEMRPVVEVRVRRERA